eukprot:1277097-Rhodomonas_salina.1
MLVRAPAPHEPADTLPPDSPSVGAIRIEQSIESAYCPSPSVMMPWRSRIVRRSSCAQTSSGTDVTIG